MLRDVISQSGFEVFQQIALLLFFVVFVAIVVRTWMRPRQEMDRYAHLPVDNGSDVSSNPGNSGMPEGEARGHE